ncbi:hypothetical protein [Colwellia sp. MEBiC06753]
MIVHGDFSVSLINNIISSRLAGSFNEAGCLAYVAAVKEKVALLNAKPFVMLIDDLALEGGTPEAYVALEDYNRWLNTQPIIAKAFLITFSSQKEIILQRTPSLAQQNIAFFKTRTDAEHWLEQQLLAQSR